MKFCDRLCNADDQLYSEFPSLRNNSSYSKEIQRLNKEWSNEKCVETALILLLNESNDSNWIKMLDLLALFF